MKSKVYFTDMRTKPGNGMYDKFDRLLKRPGFEKLELDKKMVALKIHFGEPGNLAYIRPNYAARVVR